MVVLLIGAALFAARQDNGVSDAVSDNPRLKPRPAHVKPDKITISPKADIERVIVKLNKGTRARLSDQGIVSLGNKDLKAVNEVLNRKSAGSFRRLTQKNPRAIEKEKFIFENLCGRELADFNNYFSIEVSGPSEAEQLVNELNQLDEVEIAYAEPVPVPAGDITPTTPDMVDSQVYLAPAPEGIDAFYAHTITGGDGAGIKIVDIEGDWQFDHEDLESAIDGHIGGTLLGGSWVDHGTAVIGCLIAGDNGYGVTGIVPEAEIGMISFGTLGVTEATMMATDSLEAGDIYLIELQAAGPRYDFAVRVDQLGYVCLEYWSGIYDAVELAWAKGITVCTVAGNGAEDLDDAIYENRFDTTFRNSHAIMIGAGAPPSGNYGTDRSALTGSNYGDRVNLQGYGYEVTTTGYGDLFDGNLDPLQYYTSVFSGTSAAGPIVTGAVAALQGMHKARYNDQLLETDEIRDILIATGSEQTGDLGRHIGPRPDLLAADAALQEPPGLTITPRYYDTSLILGTQISLLPSLANISATNTIDYEVVGIDTTSKSVDWISISNPTGSISPLGDISLDITIDGSLMEDRLDVYKALIEISYGVQGQALDRTKIIPLYIEVPCYDTAYTITTSADGEVEFEWIDVVSKGLEIPDYSWYNDSVDEYILDDGSAGKFYIGFKFPFYDSSYSFVYFGVNGAISLTDTNVNYQGYYSSFITIPGEPFHTFIAPFWADLNMDPELDGHGSVYFYRAPTHDSFVVQFNEMGNFEDVADTLVTFQVLLLKDGDIKMQYLDVGMAGIESTALIGVSELDCNGVLYFDRGDPVENTVSDSFAIFFDFETILWELAGDANGDGSMNIADASYIINSIFFGGPPVKRFEEGDANCDGTVNIVDASFIINAIFFGGDQPCYYEW